MGENRYLLAIRRDMLAKGLTPPAVSDMSFGRFCLRFGYEPYSPERRERQENIYAAYAAQALEPVTPLAEVYHWPIDPSAEIVDMQAERLRRRGGGDC